MTLLDIDRPLSQFKPLVWYHSGNENLPKDTTMSDEKKLSEWISTGEASKIMGVAQDTVAEHCRNKKLTCMKIGTSWAVSREDAENFERSNRGRKPNKM